MKNNITAYKVCLLDKEPVSAIKTDTRQVKYEYDKLIRPNKGQNKFLFVFATQVEAKSFVCDRPANRKYGIYQVKANNVTTIAKDKHGVTFKAERFPAGTLFCSSLRISHLLLQRQGGQY